MTDPSQEGRAEEGSVEEIMVDARGTRCPVPVLRLAGVARTLPAGTTVTVLATDPAVEHDVPAWAGMRGHELMGVAFADGVWRVSVRTGRPR